MTVTPEREKRVVDAVPTGLFIGGEWVDGSGTFEVEDPSTGEILTAVADASTSHAVAAMDAAAGMREEWADWAPRRRGDVLRRAGDLIHERAEDLAVLMTLEMGKTVAESRAELSYAAEYFRWFSAEAVRVDGRYAVAADGTGRVLVMQQAIGPCYFITPWNFPMAMGARKIGPAVAAGCTMVVKPAQQTPLSMLALADILAEAGLPPGVLNVVTAQSPRDVSESMIADSRLRKLSFTGSTEVGRHLISQSADNVLRLSMELGGNAPFLVFDDADLDAAVDGAMLAKMRNIGEACTAANRFHVHESVADEFVARFAERMAALNVGRGLDVGIDVGPLVDSAQRDRVAELVDDAVDRGARVVTGGGSIAGAGYFFSPTVLAGVTSDARILSEEVFGPVAPITTFASDDEAIELANCTEYGLASYVFVNDLKRSLRICERLETGMIGLNRGAVASAQAPFGGVKQSGFGREGGTEGIHEYLDTKYIAIDLEAHR
ncbi:MAG: NAD-dependent succinate-semialdehyde dehydrogenase [Solirubrobacteraceae bacterium]